GRPDDGDPVQTKARSIAFAIAPDGKWEGTRGPIAVRVRRNDREGADVRCVRVLFVLIEEVTVDAFEREAPIVAAAFTHRDKSHRVVFERTEWTVEARPVAVIGDVIELGEDLVCSRCERHRAKNIAGVVSHAALHYLDHRAGFAFTLHGVADLGP